MNGEDGGWRVSRRQMAVLEGIRGLFEAVVGNRLGCACKAYPNDDVHKWERQTLRRQQVLLILIAGRHSIWITSKCSDGLGTGQHQETHPFYRFHHKDRSFHQGLKLIPSQPVPMEGYRLIEHQ